MAMEHPIKIFVAKKCAKDSELTGSMNLIINKINWFFIYQNKMGSEAEEKKEQELRNTSTTIDHIWKNK